MRAAGVLIGQELPPQEAMKQVRKITVQAPIKVSDIIVRNFLGTDANLVASRSMEKQS